MKVVGVLTAGLVLALAPTGAAFASDGPHGLAHGNCGVSSAGGINLPDRNGPAGKGHGGWVPVVKAGGTCTATEGNSSIAPPPVIVEPVVLGTSEG